MSFLKGIFGSSKKEEPPKQTQQHQNVIPKQQINKEKTLNDLNIQIKNQEDNVEKYQIKLEKLDQDIKNFIAANKKPQAKQKLVEAKQIREALTSMEYKKQALVKMKIKLEIANDDQESLVVITNANQQLKDQEKVSEQLMEQMQDFNEYEQIQQQTNDMWKQMAETGTDNQEIEDEFAEYEKQVQKEQADKVKGEFDKVPQAYMSQPQQMKQASVQVQQAQPDKFASQIDDMLLN